MILSAQNWVGGEERDAARVRGLRADREISFHTCRHCGAPLAAAAPLARAFCCAGCAFVSNLVHEHGLDRYYQIRDAAVMPVGEAVFQPRDYQWLAALQRAAEEGEPIPSLTLEVQGISCAGCVWLIEKVFHQQVGSLHIETDAQLGRMHLRWRRGAFDGPRFARLLQSFNYLVGPPGAEPAQSESRRLVRRVGLSAAFSMNVMLFTLPVYFGMEATFPYARLFGTLTFLFATLSFLTGGMYFVGRAARALRARALHIDLPIAVGIVGAYLGSCYGWLTGIDRFVYFDFVAAFILLMLVGRWAQVTAVEGNRRRLLTARTRPDKVFVLRPDGSTVERPLEQLATGDRFAVRSGEVVPVEARLDSRAAVVSLAWISGEAEPRDFRAGGTVPSGAINVGRSVLHLCARQPWPGSLLEQLSRPAGRKVDRDRGLERIVGFYLAAIILVAAGAGLGWGLMTHDAVRTWTVVTAVLVVSCPCAVGLAFPLTDELATIGLRERGVFIREPDLWPRLGRIRKIVFDKTGTLTLETPVLVNPGALTRLSGTERDGLHALVADGLHPISQSLLQALYAAGHRTAFTSACQEEPGCGVSILAHGVRWSLGRPGWRDGNGAVAGEDRGDAVFARDGVALATFRFTEALRPGAREELAELRRAGFEIFILSGDRPEKVATLAAALGLPVAQAHGGLSPGEKAAWFQTHDRDDTLMLGDGANDSLAFDAAFARGTPVIHRGMLEGRADFYYLGQGLRGLAGMFAVNARRRRTHGWLLGFSAAYNAAAVGWAAAGNMHPLLAAILMPLSSLVTLGIVTLGMRKVASRPAGINQNCRAGSPNPVSTVD